ncbi:unnamed protein product [Ranitomeya imitator]|uniref:Chromo domain-containing protein n=1 Tax=Ranitomeya imitator TaxID=111125 RepID=A0ABN9KV20_9NEOB|nr:unnamed protein product [Ranitomeya imitator]
MLFDILKIEKKLKGQHETGSVQGNHVGPHVIPPATLTMDTATTDGERIHRVEVDASGIGAGAVLSQRNFDGSLMKLCAFFSRKFSPAERNYDVGNRELLAMKWAFEEWRHWLEGAKHRIVVLTDHKNLIYLESAKRLNPRQARWSLFFSRFDFVVSYIPGTKNVKADALSRSFFPDSPGVLEPVGILKEGVEPYDCPGVDSVVDRLQQIWAHVVDNLVFSQEVAQGFANRRRSLLRKYVVPVVPSVDPPAPVLIDGELEYVVEKILDSRFSRWKLQYLVKWKGYGQEDNSWVVASDVHADDLVRAFHLARPDRPGGSAQSIFDDDTSQMLLLEVCARYKPQKDEIPTSGQAVMEITLLTGLQADEKQLNKLKDRVDQFVTDYSIEDGKVILYFDWISDEDYVCAPLYVRNIFKVSFRSPGIFKVYEFHAPEQECTMYYNPHLDDNLQRVCFGDDCKCIEGECPKTKDRLDSTTTADQRREAACKPDMTYGEESARIHIDPSN